MADWVEVRTRAGEWGECDYGDYPDCAWDCPGDACSHWRAVKEPSLAEKNRADIKRLSALLRECMNQVERLEARMGAPAGQKTRQSDDDIGRALWGISQVVRGYHIGYVITAYLNDICRELERGFFEMPTPVKEEES